MQIAKTLLSLSRIKKRILSIFVDILGLILIAILAIWLRLGTLTFHIEDYWVAVLILPILALPVFITQGLYRTVVRYIGHKFALTVLSSVSLVFVIWAAAIFMLDLSFPRSAIVIAWLLALFYISSTRILARWFLSEGVVNKDFYYDRKRVLIYGAGNSGKQLLSAIAKMPNIQVMAFIDDDKSLQKHEIASVRVYKREDLQELISDFGVSEIFLAIPSIDASSRRSILEWLEPYPIKVSTLPGIDEIVAGKVSFSDIREVNIEDLLGRDQVPPQPELLSKCITNQVVMITGAGGSIGSELCRKVLRQSPKTLVLYEMSEFALYSIERELRHSNELGETQLVGVLGSVLDAAKLRRIMDCYGVNTIYHAAAYKHVPIVEHNIQEGLINNAFGTHIAAKAAAQCGVQNFVLISTDKAVRPTNVMGASKRLAEMVLQALQMEYPDTRFVMVRFGNVLGSSGSVIPLFRKQIADGGPVTVTHKEITRYFMTIPEAASLVVQAGSMGVGGDVFVLDMGEPVKIADLAKKVIKLSGLELMDESGNGDIEIQYTGLRPGEKLYEELLIGENVDGTDHPRIMKAHEEYLAYEPLMEEFIQLEASLNDYDYNAVLEQLAKIVSGFEHTSGVVDYLQCKSLAETIV
ncbi:MAG: nucleoside-diphosphate sugar epimerase/dehydratase [Thiomicrorhabdus chilensis]|uniref:polysaccharide biosynthesis protein n=1 Tax=Thiomicrorhabdus chilensis TaxID=63656 RepID=UPI00299F09E1|nr:nucleoside-diphosphate sugar epimerase/dehydratase [Thiomicrorhabdus chilensis]MDX1347428.1 nucleoside-diphosphate sugar epimerase/dehydratase [Thiomicrorhabdus chilensis]